MKERVKLIILDEKPYVVSGDEIKRHLSKWKL